MVDVKTLEEPITTAGGGNVLKDGCCLVSKLESTRNAVFWLDWYS